MRNVKTREGYEFWDKICALKNYGFLHSADRMRVVKTEGIGNWIDMHEAHEIVDQAQEEVNNLKERLADAERDAIRYRWLRENNILSHVQVTQADDSTPYVYAEELDRSVDEIIESQEAARHDSQTIS